MANSGALPTYYLFSLGAGNYGNRIFKSALCAENPLKGDASTPKTRIISTTGAETSSSEAKIENQPSTDEKLPIVKPRGEIDYLDRYAPYIVRGTIIGTGLLGVAIFARSVRLFTRFENGSQIPIDFIRKGVRLRGSVSKVERDGTLRVLHHPIARFPKMFRRNRAPGLLSVRLAGVEVQNDGASWLRNQLSGSPFGMGDGGRTVWFTLIHRHSSPDGGNDADLQCEITTKLEGVKAVPVAVEKTKSAVRITKGAYHTTKDVAIKVKDEGAVVGRKVYGTSMTVYQFILAVYTRFMRLIGKAQTPPSSSKP